MTNVEFITKRFASKKFRFEKINSLGQEVYRAEGLKPHQKVTFDPYLDAERSVCIQSGLTEHNCSKEEAKKLIDIEFNNQ